MSGAASETVHAPLLDHFAEVVAECGGNAGTLLARAGLTPEVLTPGQATYRQIAGLLELAAAALGRPDFGMVLAARQCRDGIEGELGHVMKHARSFGEMLELAVGHGYAHSLASQSWLRRFPGGAVLLGHDIVLEGLVATRQVIEQILLVGHLQATRLTGGAVRARRILLRHPRLSPPPVYRRHFGCEVRFDQRVNATLYREGDMAAPILSADPPAFREELAAVEQRFADKRLPLSRAVRGAVLEAIEDGDCTGEWVAGELGLHVRSMHRHLAREGTSFRLLRTVRPLAPLTALVRCVAFGPARSNLGPASPRRRGPRSLERFLPPARGPRLRGDAVLAVR
jgi:hypothetical protein